MRRALVAVEVAACVLLLVGAGLLLRSLDWLLAVDPGFRPDHVTTVAMNLPPHKYPDAPAQRRYTEQAMAALASLRGAEAVGAAQTIPLSMDMVFAFDVDGHPSPNEAERPSANFYAVTPGYFGAMGIALKSGRLFTSADNADGAPVIVIGESMARRFFPAGDALGKHILFDAPRKHEIIGIVADVRQYGLSRPTTDQMYTPLAQDPFAALTLVVRGSASEAQLVPELRERLRAVDPEQPLGKVRSMDAVVSDSLSRQRFAGTLLALFAVIAMLLAAVGIYGVISDAVTQRTRELGIRIALGATAAECVRLVLRQGLPPILAGLAVGLGVALAVSRVMASLLYEVSPRDTATLVGAAALIGVLAVVATYLPARRATRVSPTVALRAD